MTGRHAEGVLRHDDPLPSHLAEPAKTWSRKQESNLRLTERMKLPLYRLSYSAVLEDGYPSWIRTKPPEIRAGCPTS